MKNLVELDWRINLDKRHPVVGPIIIRVIEFTEESAKEFSHQMNLAHQTGQPVIPIIIDSFGGDIYALMSMVSEIKNAEVPVATIVESKAMSCGADLFSFGTEGYRFMDKNAALMIHDAIGYSEGKIEDIKSDIKQIEKLNKRLTEMMSENCGKAKNYFTKLIHERGHSDWYLDAREAKRCNLANHIRVPKLVTKIIAETTLE